jgi:hypothetical protein
MVKVETEGVDFSYGEDVKVEIQNFSDEEIYLNVCEDQQVIYFLQKKNILGGWDTAYVSSCSNIFDKKTHYIPINPQSIFTLEIPIRIDSALTDSVIQGIYRIKFNLVADGKELEDAYSISNSISVSEQAAYDIELTTGKTKYQIGEFANFRIKNLSNEGINLTICADQEPFYYVEKQINNVWTTVFTGQCRPNVNKESFYIGSKYYYPNNIFPGTALVDVDTVLAGSIPGNYRFRFDITGENGSALNNKYKVTNSFEIE